MCYDDIMSYYFRVICRVARYLYIIILYVTYCQWRLVGF